MRHALILGLLALVQPVAALAQSRMLAPTGRADRALRGFFFPPMDGPVRSYVPGHALILHDRGGLFAELSQLCRSSRLAADSSRAAIRQRVAAHEVKRTRTMLPRMEFGTLPPGAYIAVAWIELHLPPVDGRGPNLLRSHFGADRILIDERTDRAVVMFNTGRPGFRGLAEVSDALRCLEFLVVPDSSEPAREAGVPAWAGSIQPRTRSGR